MRAAVVMLLAACAGPHTSSVISDVLDGGGSGCIIVLDDGQSNEQGKGRTIDTVSDPTLLNAYTPVLYDAIVISNTVEPMGSTGVGEGAGGGLVTYSYGQLEPFKYESYYKFGFELTQGRDLDAAYPGLIHISKYAIGGAELGVHFLAGGTFPTTSTSHGGPNLAHIMLERARGTVATSGCTRVVLDWGQGESDAKYLADANAYQANLTAFVALFRAEWPGMLVVVHKLNSDYIHAGNNNGKYTTTVQAAEAAFVAADSNAVLVDLDSILPNPLDHTHYTSQGYLDAGHLIATATLAHL